MTTTILTNDPSLTAWGYAVLTVGNGIVLVDEVSCIKTSPDYKKLRIRKGDDRVRRAEELTRQLKEVCIRYDVDWILSELPHGSQSAVAAVMIGLTTGIVVGLSEGLGISVEWFSDTDAKKAVLQRRSVSKAEMIQAITSLYDVPWTAIQYKDEAIADAMAVFHCARQHSPFIKRFLK